MISMITRGWSIHYDELTNPQRLDKNSTVYRSLAPGGLLQIDVSLPYDVGRQSDSRPTWAASHCGGGNSSENKGDLMGDNLRGSETRENDCDSQWPGRVREG